MVELRFESRSRLEFFSRNLKHILNRVQNAPCFLTVDSPHIDSSSTQSGDGEVPGEVEVQLETQHNVVHQQLLD